MVIKNTNSEVTARIAWHCDIDQYDNPVSQITLRDGYQLRMVSHSKPHQFSQRYTIYANRNKFVRLKIDKPEDKPHVLFMAGYTVEYLCGKINNLICPPIGPDMEMLKVTCESEDFDKVIIEILSAIARRHNMWEAKTH
jgi:hypothetical protein